MLSSWRPRRLFLLPAILLAGSVFTGVASASHPVPATPDGPAVQLGGWTVEYADAFGSCLSFTDTKCAAGYPRSDGSWSPQTNAGGFGNSNEIEAFEPSHDNVTSKGLVQTCTQVASLGDSYTCAALLGNGADGGLAGTTSNAPTAPGAFYFDPGAAATVIQYKAQLPADQGNMDPSVWENSKGDDPEVDNAEYFGMHAPPSQANSWCGMGWAFPNIPFGGSITGDGDNTYWCQSPGLSFDPSAAMHVYTVEFAAGSYTGFVDGTEVTSGTYSFTTEPFKLILGLGMRRDATTGLAYGLPSGGAKFRIRYVVVYEAASANGAGSNGPMIEPGTTVG